MPQGGFGNRVLSYLSLRMIAQTLSAPYFSINKTDRRLIEGIHKPLLVPMRLRNIVELPKEAPRQEDFLGKVGQLLDDGATLVLKSPQLGEAYARYASLDPAQMVAHHFSLCATHRREAAGHSTTVLHLRGTDFAQWNPDAILGEDYYRDALALLGSRTEGHLFRICTDDPSHASLGPVVAHLQATGRRVSSAQCSQPFECDFAAMTGARFLISSPSTFSISAGLLGKAAVVHSQRWVDNRLQRGELFWEQVSRNALVGLDVAGLV